MSLHGDGINDELFFLLWAKDNLNYGPSVNLPDTVVYKFGQPVAWYFTGIDGKVRRKNKQNLINVRIEEAFNKYGMCGDIVAYYISLPTGLDDEADPDTRIEYFDKKGLHDFLYNRWKESNGILQRFIEPKGTHNSMIRVIWSPKVCMAERRSNVRHIFDRRFGLYERAVTYEGQDYHSKVAPLRGNILVTKIQKTCEDLVEHVAEVTFQKQRIARLVVNFKVDARDRLYLLWSSSVRLEEPKQFSVNVDMAKAVRRNSLNIDSQLKLPKFIRLADKANHAVEQPVPVQFIDCISCGKKAAIDCFHELPYKTVIAHYEGLIWLLTLDPVSGTKAIEWPPDPRVIEAAGSVGFGCLNMKHDDDAESLSSDSASGSKGKKKPLLSTEDVAIPPIIRHLHPKLKLLAYKRYKKDPLFLYKNAVVCEECYLVYAEYANSAFNMNPMLNMVLQKPAMAAMFGRKSPQRPSKHMCKRPPEPCERQPKSRPRTWSSALESYSSPALGRPAINAPILPGTIRTANDAQEEYGTVLDRIHTAQTQSSKEGLDELIKGREDAFFKDAYKSRELHQSHPLMHLITTYKKLKDLRSVNADDTNNQVRMHKNTDPHKPGMSFAGYSDELSWTFKKKRKGESRQSRASTRTQTASTAMSSIPGSSEGGAGGGAGRSTAGSRSITTSSSIRFVASKASTRHQEFLLKTLAEVQAQLSSPGAMTRSILETLSSPPGTGEPSTSITHPSISLALPSTAGSPPVTAPAPQSARSRASVKSEKSRVSAGPSVKSSHSHHSQSKQRSDASRGSHSSPKGRRPSVGPEEDAEGEADVLPRVVLQDEMEVDGRVVSVTGYEEEDGSAGSAATHLMLSLMATELVGEGPRQWRVVVTDGDLGLGEGGIRGMSMEEKRSAGRRACGALRWGGQPGGEFVYLAGIHSVAE